MRKIYQEEILNVDQVGYVYVEKYNIKIDIKLTQCEGMDQIHVSGEGRVAGCSEKDMGNYLAI